MLNMKTAVLIMNVENVEKVENSLEIVEIYCTLSRHVNHYRLLFVNGANNFDQMRVAFSFVVHFLFFNSHQMLLKNVFLSGTQKMVSFTLVLQA